MTDKLQPEDIRGEALRLVRSANNVYYGRLARSIEERFDCRIFFAPSGSIPFKGTAQAHTYSRIATSCVCWPDDQTFGTWEHWIFYDEGLTSDLAAMAIGHELGHIVLHLKEDPLKVDRDDEGRAKYTPEQEQEANVFAACLLRWRPAIRQPGETWLGESEILSVLQEYAERMGGEGELDKSIPALEKLIREGFFR